MGIKILFADDDPSMRQIVKLSLELRGKAEGVEVLTVSNGKEAVAKAKEDKSIDIVLLDYQMPPGNDGGVWAAEQLKGTASVIVVFLSAYTRQSNVDAAEQAGALAYIGKETILEETVSRDILAQDWPDLQRQANLVKNLWFFEKNQHAAGGAKRDD